MMYVKGILVGAAAFLVAVISSGVIAIAVTIRFPELAMRIFPAQSFDIQWGEFYSLIFLFGRPLSWACWHSSSLSYGWSQGRRRECEYWHVYHPAGSVAVADPDDD